MPKVFFLIAVLGAALLTSATAHAQSQPYAAFADRSIKALSADDVAGLRAGRGMAMALPAELNRYPGPLRTCWNTLPPWI